MCFGVENELDIVLGNHALRVQCNLQISQFSVALNEKR